MSATNLTMGEIRFQCQKRHPGVDQDVLDSFINERYRRICRRLPWGRRKVQAVIQTVALYETGTVAVTQASQAITGTDTVWTSAMTGRGIRFNDENDYYEFTYASGTTATLDRPYQGDTDATVTYDIFQNIFVLPSDCERLLSMRLLGSPRDMDQFTQERMDEVWAARTSYGEPTAYALHMEDLSTPPRQQVEVYPIPDEVLSIPFWYIQDPTLFEISATASYIAAWLNPDALYNGVSADVCRLSKDYVGAVQYEQMYEAGIKEMVASECARMPGVQLKMASRFTRHRDARGYDRIIPFELP